MIAAKKMKKLTALTLALGLTLTGCGAAANPGEEPATRVAAESAQGNAETAQAVSTPIALVEIPETPQMPDYESYAEDPETYELAYDKWLAARQERESFYEGNARALQAFNASTVPVFLAGEGENKVYSPINVFLALSMLSQVCDGETKQEILNLLGLSDTELAGRVRALWNANTVGDETLTSQLANSLWISNTYPYNAETLQKLAETFYADSYAGTMGSSEYNA